MIGGTNQINLSLLIAGTFFAVPSRYYYIFQSQADLLHPEIEKPHLNCPDEIINVFREKWHEIPLFHLEIGGFIQELDELFSSRDIINLNEIENILSQYGFRKQCIPKLRGRLINIGGDRVSKGPLFDIINGMISKIKK